jgi:hypothetical protein
MANVEMTFLTKDNCPLCDRALETVQALRREHKFKLTIIKVKPGDEWFDQYWDKIPVGLAGGRMLFKYRIKPEDLLRKLQATMVSEPQ